MRASSIDATHLALDDHGVAAEAAALEDGHLVIFFMFAMQKGRTFARRSPARTRQRSPGGAAVRAPAPRRLV